MPMTVSGHAGGIRSLSVQVSVRQIGQPAKVVELVCCYLPWYCP